jgi:tetratricopeptide (TPR) repeat protein
MRRFTLAAAVSCVLVLVPRGSAQEEVTYYDLREKKEVRISGAIEEETTAGIRIKAKGEVQLIPTGDIRHVAYKNDAVSIVEFRALALREARALAPREKAETRKKALAELLKNYEEMAAKVKNVPPAHRYIRFKIAFIKFQQSRDDPSQLDAARAALEAFKTDHDPSWQTVLCLTMLARVREDQGAIESATRTYQELAVLPGLPADVQRDSAILEGQLLLRARKFAAAEKHFQALVARSSTKDAQWARLQVLLIRSQLGQDNLARAQAQLQAVLHATDDAAVKAMAYNTLGDFYLHKEQLEDAFWQYLKVDTLYHQEREELARALYHLAKLFVSVKNDPIRARQCLEKLKSLEGTEYQKKIADRGSRIEGCLRSSILDLRSSI